MIKKISYLLATFLAGAVLLTPVLAIAHDGETETTTNTGSSQNSGSGSSSSSSSSDDDTSKIETENHTMEDRISEFKTHFKVKLAATEIAHIKLKCVGAQGVVGKLHTKFGNSVTVRTQAYTELQKNLDKLVSKLKAKNVDTTALEQEITTLKTKIDTYSTDLTAYKQALADLKAVNCKTDPDGFQAALLAARAAHDKLVADVLAVRTYLVGTIKPTLKTIKQELAAQEDKKDSTNQSNDSSNSGSSN